MQNSLEIGKNIKLVLEIDITKIKMDEKYVVVVKVTKDINLNGIESYTSMVTNIPVLEIK